MNAANRTDRLKMERRAREMVSRMDLPAEVRAKYKSVLDKLEVLTWLEAAWERKRARIAEGSYGRGKRLNPS